MWVDNPFVVFKVLKVAFPHLGEGLFKGDSGIRWDFSHFLRNMGDTMVQTLKSFYSDCMKELRSAFIVPHPDPFKAEQGVVLALAMEPFSQDLAFDRFVV
jgi:hypothetical protein